MSSIALSGQSAIASLAPLFYAIAGVVVLLLTVQWLSGVGLVNPLLS